jgi:membrane protein YdbS with pleckstrin-like domain
MAFHLDKDEYVIHESRRSWFVIWARTTVLVFSILIPIILLSILSAVSAINFGENEGALFMVIVLTWAFIVWNFIFVAWTDHYLDILVITNKHLIDIEQKGIFSRDIAVLQISKIQDINTEINGFIQTVLGYGNLNIQSAGYEKEFKLVNVDNPDLVRSKIKEAIAGEVPNEENEV